MKQLFRMICCAAALFLAACGNSGKEEDTTPLKGTVAASALELGSGETKSIVMTVTPWKSSYSPSEVKLSVDGVAPVGYSVSGVASDGGGKYTVYISDANAGNPYDDRVGISLKMAGQTIVTNVFTVKSSAAGSGELPVIRVTASAPVVDTDTWIDGTIEIDGKEAFEDLPLMNIMVKGRGNSTWAWEKKPYALKFSEKKEVLGMPRHKRWCLIANYMDKTLMRNRIAHYIGEHTALAWTPRTRFADVYFNDEYVGNYLMVEQIKIDEERLDIDEMAPEDILGDALTGGYLLELDSYFDEVNKFRSGYSEMPVNIKSPDEITQQQFDYIRDYFNKADNLLFSKMFNHPTTGYSTMFDVLSFVDFWIVNEVMGNQEIKHPKSFYMYKPRSGKLTAGPIWDFDYGTLTQEGAQKWLVKNTNLWMERLLFDPTFRKKARERWTALYPFLSTIPAYIEGQRSYIGESAARNFERWPEIKTEQPNGDENLSFDQAVDRLIKSYTDRIEWMNAEISSW